MSVDMQNLILSGSILRSTEFVIGLTVYVGEKTKIQQNVKKGVVHESWLFKRIHQQVYVLMGVVFLVALVISFLSDIMSFKFAYTQLEGDQSNAYQRTVTHLREFALRLPKTFGLSLLHISHTIPMSIYVAVETLKLIQKNLIETDKNINLQGPETIEIFD